MNASLRLSIASAFAVLASVAVAPGAGAQGAPGFPDVPSSHFAYQAVNYLQEQGLIQGYADGTFRPNQEVDRAAALKMVLAGRVSEEEVAGLGNPGYGDIPEDAWYRGYAAKAVQLGIIDGPDKKPNFQGGRAVIRAEFLKLLLLAQQVSPNSYSEITSPLSVDVADSGAWFYPYYRVAMASSVVQINSDGLLLPEKRLTRAEVAVFVHRLLMYKENRRTQALLSITETELASNLIPNLNAQGLGVAKMAQTRALVAIRGALTSRSDSDLVKGAVKVTEGFGALVSAYEAGVGGDPQRVIELTKIAYDLAVKAKEFSPSLDGIAGNMQMIAHNMADEARAILAKAAPQ